MSAGGRGAGRSSPNPFAGAGSSSSSRPPLGHTRQQSSTSALRTGVLPGSGAEILHRHSSSIDRRNNAGVNNAATISNNATSANASTPSSNANERTMMMSNNPFLSNNISVLSPPTLYSNTAHIPSSPELHFDPRTGAGHPGSGSGSPSYFGESSGGRGIKHAGVGGLFGFGGPRRGADGLHDDGASVTSLIDRDTDYDGASSYDGHSGPRLGGLAGSEVGHSSMSTHHDNDSYLYRGSGGRARDYYPSITNKYMGPKTSYKDFKDSEHKIISNEEKYNAYVLPGVVQFDGPEADDALHDPGPRLKGQGPDRRLADSRELHGTTTVFSWRGWLNFFGLMLIIVSLVALFAVYPITTYVLQFTSGAVSDMYTNSTGQIPLIPNFRGLVDKDTPQSAYTKIGQDGQEYTLVFSDEFETPGRTFYEGDDPYWTALDMHYYSTNDIEYYDPSAVTTADGYLVINLTKADPALNHNLSYMSGMLQSWNQFCFTGGIVEASASIPGNTEVTGLWPAFWTMGNLGRAGYGSTLEGTWPYTYDTCDTGTLPNQTDFKTTTEALTSTEGYPLSYLPGQKLSACTCAGEDHPGPSNNVGRAAPELDVFEALVNPVEFYGEISQTMQVAPFDMDYRWPNASGTYFLSERMKTELNAYRGGIFQQSISALSHTDQESYYLVDRTAFNTYSYEYKPSTGTNYDGYVYWLQGDQVDWSLKEAGMHGNPSIDMGQRLIPREPMYMIMNLGMAENFNTIDYDNLRFPAIMRFDYVRVYQPTNAINIGCDPKDYPTADYINRHIEGYTNYNLTIWTDVVPEGFPKNSLLDGCT